MERLARKLANNIAFSLGFDAEKEAVVAYGLSALIQTIVTVLLVLISGLIIGAPVEAMIICFSVSVFRKYSGGAHAGSAGLCTAVSAVYCTAAALICRRLLLNIYNLYLMLAAIVIIYLLSAFAVFKRAPIDSPNKPIRTEKKKRKMRKGSFIVLTVYFLLSMGLLLLGLKYKILNSFGISLLFGIAWQIFTLTDPGALFLHKLEKIIRGEVY